MAHQSLQFVAEEQQVAKRYVERCLKSSKRNKVFCLVEGELDYKIYNISRLQNYYISSDFATFFVEKVINSSTKFPKTKMQTAHNKPLALL